MIKHHTCFLCIGLMIALWGSLASVDGVFATFQDQISQPAPESTLVQLTAGQNVQRTLLPGTVDRYDFSAQADAYVELTLMSKGGEFVVQVVDPDGKQIHELGGTVSSWKIDQLWCLTSQAGRYQFTIALAEKMTRVGQYEVTLEVSSPGNDQFQARKEINRLASEVDQFEKAKKFDQAFPPARRAVELAESVLGPDHLLSADCRHRLGKLCRATNDLTQAEPCYQQALAVYEKQAGTDHPEVATCLTSLGVLFLSKRDWSQAEFVFQRALKIRETALGADDPSVARSLCNLADCAQGKSDSEKAIGLYQQALAIQEKAYGKDHSKVADILNDLASLYLAQADYPRAEPLLRRCLEISEQTLGSDHPDTAITLGNLAMLHRARGDYARAKPELERVLAIFNKNFGPDHLESAPFYNNLAAIHTDLGDFVQAEPLYQRALALREKWLGAEHADTVLTLMNLGNLYQAKGDYQKAEPMLRRSLAIQEKLLGPNHPTTARNLNSLALLLYYMKQYPEAESLYERSLAIREKVMGVDHPSVAILLNNLGLLNYARKEWSKAETQYQRALKINEKAYGPDHPETSQFLNNLAGLYQGQGKFDLAESLYQRSIAITQKTLAAYHPWTGYVLMELGNLYAAKGELEPAVSFVRQGNEAIEANLRLNLLTGSERQKLLYLRRTQTYFNQTLSLHLTSAPNNPQAQRTALAAIFRRKGRVLDAMALGIETLRQQAQSEAKTLLEKLFEAKSKIARFSERGPGKEGIEVFQKRLRELEAAADAIEAEVNAKSAEYRIQTQPVTLEAIQQAIPPGAVLVEYVLYHPKDPRTHKLELPRYAVYTLNQAGEIGCADLGPAEVINQKIAEWYKLMRLNRTSRNLTRLEPSRMSPAESSAKAAGRALDQLILDPARRFTSSYRHLLISPDSELNLVSFAGLVDTQGKYLIETQLLTYLTSGRDLLRFGASFQSKAPPLVLADPDYAVGSGPTLSGQSFRPLQSLPGTNKEGREVARLLPGATVKLKSEATVQAVKNAVRPEVLHIATHGYFLPNIARERVDAPELAEMRSVPVPAIGNDVLRAGNPLLRSYLFFAGANRGDTETDSGVMTALEAANLNLRGTKLVVLSACSTGVGAAMVGEGVYGLRRALVLAGSSAQMVSLWEVSDRATQQLMVDYYTRLKAGEGRSEALRNTQLKMLKDPRRRHPFYWASFIQSGEWKPL